MYRLTYRLVRLLVYATLSPSTMGAGYAHLGSSYGALRLALLLSALSAGVEACLVHRVGEELLVSLLDSLRGHWPAMSRAQRLTQALLLLALGASAVLWMRRVEWGVLLIAHGLWAHAEHSHEHLTLFAAATTFSVLTDALTLAADAADTTFVEGLTWTLVVAKVVVVAMLLYTRQAFV